MHDSEKPTVTRARKAILGSDPPMRKMIGKWKQLPYTFLTRAISEQLPTHDREAKRITTEGRYRERYGDKLQGGACQRCQEDNRARQETVQHIMSECPHHEAMAIRDKARKKAEQC